MHLPKSHRMAVSRDTVFILDIIGERDCHKSMDNLIKQTKAGPSLPQSSPSEFLYDLSYTCLFIEIINCPASCSALDLFQSG